MALYHFSAYIVGRKEKHRNSAVRTAAYQSRARLIQEPTKFDPPNPEDPRKPPNYDHDFRHKGGLVHEEIVAPKTAPEWAHDRERLWNAAHQAEKRKDSQIARWFDVALPAELSHQQRVQLVRGFVYDHFVKRGLVADFAIHAPEEGNNHHAHFLISTRQLKGDGFAKTKHPDFRGNKAMLREQLKNITRPAWAEHVNAAYERANLPHRVDHRSFADRMIDRRATVHMGYNAIKREREGKGSTIGDRNRAIIKMNAQEAELSRAKLELEAKRTLDRVPVKTKSPERRPVAAVFAYRADPAPATKRERAWAQRDWERVLDLKRREDLALLDLDRKLHPQTHALEADQKERNGRFRNNVLADIEAIERRLSNTGTTRFFRNVFGLNRRDEQQKELHQLTLAALAKREAEERHALAADHERQKLALMGRYARLREKLETKLALEKETRNRNRGAMSERKDKFEQARDHAQGRRASQTERPPPKPVPAPQPTPPYGAKGPLFPPTPGHIMEQKIEAAMNTPEGRKAAGLEDPRAREDFTRQAQTPVPDPRPADKPGAEPGKQWRKVDVEPFAQPERMDWWNDHKRSDQAPQTITREWWKAAEAAPAPKAEPGRENDQGRGRERE
ncbi:MobA/MobL family protein [Methylobacterium sp. 1030]|uniref:MobA/MobL family protein n=1 Tax=Methylobacterium sp. 1030 TaxID=3156404 RepID=UPI003395C814